MPILFLYSDGLMISHVTSVSIIILVPEHQTVSGCPNGHNSDSVTEQVVDTVVT